MPEYHCADTEQLEELLRRIIRQGEALRSIKTTQREFVIRTKQVQERRS